MRDLPKWVQPGVSFKYDFGPDNDATGRKFHVRGIVDGLAVIREWRKSMRRWDYKVEGPEYFHVYGPHIVKERAK